MENKKVIQTLYSGLGGHGNVTFSLLDTDFKDNFSHVLVFYGVENVLVDYQTRTKELGLKSYTITKTNKRYIEPLNRFFQILLDEKPDYILIHNSELVLTAIKYRKKNRHCKVIYVEHEANHTKPFIGRFLSKYALKKSDSVICLNDNYKTELLQKYKAKTEIQVIPNGINTQKYLPKSYHSTVATIGMASRLVDFKGT